IQERRRGRRNPAAQVSRQPARDDAPREREAVRAIRGGRAAGWLRGRGGGGVAKDAWRHSRGAACDLYVARLLDTAGRPREGEDAVRVRRERRPRRRRRARRHAAPGADGRATLRAALSTAGADRLCGDRGALGEQWGAA